MTIISMKTFILLISFIAVNRIKLTLSAEMTDEMKELMQTLHETCQGETGVAEDFIVNARTGNFAEDQNLKCYMFCILDQMAIVEDDGTIDEEGMLAIMPDDQKDQAEKMIKGCGTKPGADHCDKVFQTNKCYYEMSPKDYMLP